ncbi:MAG TPA: hypothetical protein VHB79_29680, partial [Polyangiaceae bacterium]|nr:hypothetical protein [Polyangiaceae bacterium]
KKKLSGGSQRTLSVALSSLSLAELLIAQALYARRPRPVRTRLPERIRMKARVDNRHVDQCAGRNAGRDVDRYGPVNVRNDGT